MRITHTHQPGPLVSILLLLQFQPIRYCVYGLVVALAGLWLWDRSTEFTLPPSEYQMRFSGFDFVAGINSVDPHGHLGNTSKATIQSVDFMFRYYDCPTDEAPIEACDKLWVQHETLDTDLAPGEGVGWAFLRSFSGNVKGVVRMTVGQVTVTADRDTD